jgi:O-antigen ligase
MALRRFALPALAFLIASAYWPFWDGGAITPRWAILASGVLLLWGTPVRVTTIHWLGAAFIVYAALSGLWAAQPWPWFRDLWYLVAMAGVFCVAAEQDDLTPAYIAFAVGVAISGFLALPEAQGWIDLPNINHPAGLFGNKNYLAETAVVALVAVLPQWRRWWMWPVYLGLAMAIALPRARGALLGLDVVLIVYFFRHNAIAGAALLLATAAAGWLMLGEPSHPEANLSNTFILRAAIAWSTLMHATWFGHGLGQFFTEFPLWTPHVTILSQRPAEAHNEVINVIAELGLPGVVLWLAFFAVVLWRAAGCVRLALLALLAISLTSFPLHLPATGFMVALLAADAVIARRRVLLEQPVRRDHAGGWLAGGTRRAYRPGAGDDPSDGTDVAAAR